MPPKFGTSGLRGLVTELTPELVARHVNAFLACCSPGGAVHVGRDLRASSPEIAGTVLDTVQRAGLDVIDHGALPTPALALASMQAGQSAIMVTGSHIPADRNGLKFYTPSGEITKAEERAIVAALGETPSPGRGGARYRVGTALPAYGARYVAAFGVAALDGLRIGVYEHSSVARDVMQDALAQMGAEVVPLDRAETFVPVDTEAVDPRTRRHLADWCRKHRLDALVSTDGDGDRPMVTDATGRIVPGDVLGPLTAQALGAEVIVTPVSSNTLVDSLGFDRVLRTRIGSPFVIAAMKAQAGGAVAGYEANGGFLLGFAARGPEGGLSSLLTRDSLLPMIAPLAMARAKRQALADLVAELPPRFTAADRIQGIASEKARDLLAALSEDRSARTAFFDDRAAETGIDLTDGLRVTFADETIIHLRPSGNAPEFRCYAEAGDRDTAERLMRKTLDAVAARLG